MILTANNTLVMMVHYITFSCFFNGEHHLRCGAAGDPNSQQHAGDCPLWDHRRPSLHRRHGVQIRSGEYISAVMYLKQINTVNLIYK